MKIQLVRKSKQRGSALLTTLFICTLLALGLAGYLTLIEQQNFLSARSQTWNMAMAIVESGIEDGLQQYHSNTNNLASNGWSSSGGGLYTKIGTLDDGNGSSYTVTIDVSNPANPLVTSRASLSLPTFATQFYAAITGNSGSMTVNRAVQVSCSQTHNFNAAMIVKQDIVLNGNGVYTDSYDSSDPTKSSNGVYNVNLYSGDFGDVATDGGIINGSSVSVGNGNIYGHVHTGPGAQVSVGPNGGVGTHSWQAGNSGFEPGYVLDDANFTFPDTTIPSGVFPQPLPGSIVTTYYTNNPVTTNSLPSPLPPGGVQTNAFTATVPNVPNPLPTGIVTNTSWVTSATAPSSSTPGTITNAVTASTTTSSFPSAGTYIGGVTTNYNGSGKNVKNYTYNLITGYTYTYPVYSYTYPYYTYTYCANPNSVTNSYTYVLYPGQTYKLSTMLGPAYVAGGLPQTNAVLILTGGLTGSEQFTIAKNARVRIYSDKSVAIGGNNVVNANGYAGSFVVYGTTNVTSFTLNGNGTFTGIVVAPWANMTLKGSGNNPQDFCGCLIANSITMTGHFGFHYDEALGHDPANGRFLIQAWNEIDPNH